MTEQLYYVQDARYYVGNCILWWRNEGMGYTTDLDDAGLFTASEVASMRDTDIAWPQSDVENHLVRHVRIEALRRDASERSIRGGIWTGAKEMCV